MRVPDLRDANLAFSSLSESLSILVVDRPPRALRPLFAPPSSSSVSFADRAAAHACPMPAAGSRPALASPAPES